MVNILSTIHFSILEKWSVDNSDYLKISSRFALQRLSKIATRVKDVVIVEDEVEYKRIKVRLYGNGIVQRDCVYGKNIGTKRQFRAKAGQLIISRIDARNGAFGIVPQELDGAIVTNDFWLFDVANADIKYVMSVLCSDRFQEYWQNKSNGTTNRQRVDEQDFLNSKIPYPSIQKQTELVHQYEEVMREIAAYETRARSLEERIEAYLFESLGIEKVPEEVEEGTLLKFSRLKNISKWGYDKLSHQFPYRFTKNRAFSLSTMPKWCVSIVRGKSPVYDEASNYYLINQKCNRWDVIDMSFSKSVKSSWLKGIDPSLLTTKGDIIINSTGEGTIGRSSLVREDYHVGLMYDSHILKLTVDNKFVNPQLLVYLLNSSYGQNQIEVLKGAQATKQTELGIDNMKKVLFPFPDIDSQNKIACHIDDIKNEIKALHQKTESLRSLAKKQFEEAVFGE